MSSIIKNFFIFVKISLWLILFLQPLSALELQEIRIGNHNNYGRMVIVFDRQIIYRLFTLHQPNRLVIDIPEAALLLPATANYRSPYFKDYRTGLFQKGLSRIVIDLHDKINYKNHFVINNDDQFRLVIDVIPNNNKKRYNYQSNKFDNYLASITDQQQSIEHTIIEKSANHYVIAIDPGHGGPDPGAIDANGDYEKHITLRMGLLLKKILSQNPKYKVILTRDKDIYLPLRKRFAIAEKMQADLFISLHADKAPNKNTRGATVFTLSENASDKEAELLAQKENKADLIVGEDLSAYEDDVARILLDLEQRSTLNESVDFASLLVKELKSTTKVVRNTHRFAGFAVLKSPSIPSVLIELGFMSNPKERKLLKTDQHLQKLAIAIKNAIDKFH